MPSRGETETIAHSHLIELYFYKLQLIISPVIDAINDTTMNYRFITKDLYGLMNWRMDFEWCVLISLESCQLIILWELRGRFYSFTEYFSSYQLFAARSKNSIFLEISPIFMV